MWETVRPQDRRRQGVTMGHEAECFIESGELCRCLDDLDRYLAVMASRIDIRCPVAGQEFLLETSMVGSRYNVTFVCQARGQRRLMAVMTEPYAARFLLGRVLPDGSSRIISNGALIFFDYLWHEGLFQDFRRDLSESLALCDMGRQVGPPLA